VTSHAPIIALIQRQLADRVLLGTVIESQGVILMPSEARACLAALNAADDHVERPAPQEEP
jgi:hypothetical protein